MNKINQFINMNDIKWQNEYKSIKNYKNIYGKMNDNYKNYINKEKGTNIMNNNNNEEYKKLLEKCNLWGYMKQNHKERFKNLFQNKDILDVGMGQGPFAVYYIHNGANSYTGVDPSILLDGSKIRDFRIGCGLLKKDIDYSKLTKDEKNELDKLDDGRAWYHNFNYTPNDIMNILPNVKLIPNILEDCIDKINENSKDLVMLSCVSEHLEHLPEVIEYCWKFLKNSGKLYLTHGNYYSWAGHHQLPRTPKTYEINNKNHNIYIDWQHYSPLNPAYHNRTMNRVRLYELKKLIEKYFIIEYWDEELDISVLERLTLNIRDKWKEYTLSEMLCNVPKLIAIKRKIPLDYDIDKNLYFHPRQEIENNISNYILDPLLKHESRMLKLYRKEYMNLIFNNNEIILKINNFNDTESDKKKIKSLGIHLLLAESILDSNNKHTLEFEAKSSKNINLKIYTGNKWLVLDNQLTENYQKISINEYFNFNTKSKYRIGINNPINELIIYLKNFKFV